MVLMGEKDIYIYMYIKNNNVNLIISIVLVLSGRVFLHGGAEQAQLKSHFNLAFSSNKNVDFCRICFCAEPASCKLVARPFALLTRKQITACVYIQRQSKASGRRQIIRL